MHLSTNPLYADMKRQGHHHSFGQQAENARAREETLKLEAERLGRPGPPRRAGAADSGNPWCPGSC